MKKLTIVFYLFFLAAIVNAQLPEIKPHAPDLALSHDGDGRIYFTLSNSNESNNYQDGFSTYDAVIDDDWEFEGYQIWQIIEPFSPDSLRNVDWARVVIEMDIENELDAGTGIFSFVNWKFDDELGSCIPWSMYQGDNTGIEHVVRHNNDLFSGFGYEIGQEYCFVAGAFASNPAGNVDENCGQLPPDAHNTYHLGLEDPEGNINVKCILLTQVSVIEVTAPEIILLGSRQQGSFFVQSSYINELEIWSLDGRHLESKVLTGAPKELSSFHFFTSGVYIISGVSSSGEHLQMKVALP